MTAKTKRAAKKPVVHHRHKPQGVSAKSFERVYWPYLPLILIVSLLLVVGGQSGALSAALRNPTGGVLAYASSMSVSGLLSSTNGERAAGGVAGLSLNGKLNAAAQAKANDMAARNYWSHNTPEGNPPWVFVTAQGYSYQKLGENLAAGFSSESSTVAGWMASPPHKANLLDPAFAEVGFGFANNENYTSAGGGPMTIVVAMYGKPTVLAAAPAPAPTAKKTPPKTAEVVQPEPAPEPEQPPAPAAAPTEDQEPPSSALNAPLTSDGLTNATLLGRKTSFVEAATAALPAPSLLASLATLGVFVAAGVWLFRHALTFHRAVIRGESFVIRHPLVDLGLVAIAALSFLLTRTAGFIQ